MLRFITCLFILGGSANFLHAQESGAAEPAENETTSAVPDNESPAPKTDTSAEQPSTSAPTTPSPTPESPKSSVPEKKGGKSSTQNPTKPSSKGLGRLADLKLSPEQTAAMIEARKSWNNEQEKTLREEVKAAKDDLASAMIDGSSSEDVRKKFLWLQKKYNDLQTLKFEKSLRIREILNLEQRKKFQEIRSKQSDP